MLRIIIAGDRKFKNLHSEVLIEMTSLTMDTDLKDIQVIYSNELGAFTIGQKFAEEYFTATAMFPTLREVYGDKAAHIRNKTMVENADYLIAFINYNQKPSDVKDIVDIAINKKLSVRTISYGN